MGVNPENVQFPVYTTINPTQVAAEADPEAMHSRVFIQKFTAKDTSPITVVDDATQAARNQQIIRITKALLARTLKDASDAQVLQMHRDHFAGRF
jgi:hypothetical protein